MFSAWICDIIHTTLNIPNRDLSPNKCIDCGSELILMEVTVHTSGNNPSPITKTTYRCSNDACQEECDKRTAKRIEIKREQDLARENRKKNLATPLAVAK